MSTLLSLPNELSFQIFDDLDGADLFSLAKSCRHLNIIAISCYLSRHGVLYPHQYISFGFSNFHILPFLRISVQLTSIDGIFWFGSICNYSELRGLERLVVKLSSVKTVYLDLYGFYPSIMREDGLIQIIHGLLAKIIARSCTSLTFIISDLMNSERMLQGPPPKQDAHDSLLDTSHCSKLAELVINTTSMLFHPLFLHWAIKLISASPITTLSLKNAGEKFPWDGLLSAIDCPTLSEFRIAADDQQISFPSFATFLARHQTVTSVECQGLSRRDDKYPMISLPGIAKLDSPLESVVHILEDAAFPSLRGISLNPYPDQTNLFNPSAMNDALECIRRYPNELELTLKFDREDNALAAWLDVDVNGANRIERSMHQVVCLNWRVSVLASHQSNETLLALPKWLALFPTLRLLTLEYCLPNERATELKFVHSVIQACSRLETLTLNLETHTVNTWLAMKEFH